MEVPEEVVIGGEPFNVRVRGSKRDTRVGHALVKVGHEVVLRHDRKLWQVLLIERFGVDIGKPLTVPWRALLGNAHELP